MPQAGVSLWLCYNVAAILAVAVLKLYFSQAFKSGGGYNGCRLGAYPLLIDLVVWGGGWLAAAVCHPHHLQWLYYVGQLLFGWLRCYHCLGSPC